MTRPGLRRLQQVAARGERLWQNVSTERRQGSFQRQGCLSSIQASATRTDAKPLPLSDVPSQNSADRALNVASPLRSSVCPHSSGVIKQSWPPSAVCGLVPVSSFHSSAWRPMGLPQASEPEGDSEAEQRSPPSDRVKKLVEEIAGLTLLEVSDLTNLLKQKLGLPDMPMGGMPMMMPPGMMPAAGSAPAGAAEAAAEPEKVEKTSFDVKLEKFDAASKLKVIKEVRAITGLGLKESKELVESAPAVIKKGVPKEEAESIVEKLKAVGAEMALE